MAVNKARQTACQGAPVTTSAWPGMSSTPFTADAARCPRE